MLSRIWEQLKAHKVLVGVVLVGVIFFTYFMRGSASGSAATVDPNAATGDNTLQTAQLAAQTQMAQTNAAAQAAHEQTAAGSHVADLSYQLQSDANTLNANIASQQMADSLQYLTSHDTLQASYANHALDVQTQQLQISTAAQTQGTRILANALVQQAGIKAQAQVQTQQAASCAWYNPTCW
jgi:hypothetical protein